MPLSFKGGINIDNIVKGALTIMPLQQSRDIIYTIPQDFLCCVCEGDSVACDDYIAVHPDGSVFVSHVNGSITKIEDNRIYIEWDGTTPDPLYPLAMTIDGLDKREILDYIRLSGLFSETGVPLWRMLSPFLGCADTLIINGAETNPGVTCRHAVLRAYPDKMVGGIKIVMRALSLRKSILVMTEHMQTEAAAIRERLEQKNLIDIYGVVSKYPAESDKVMFSALTGCNREPSSRKTVILSVHDCIGIYDLFTKGRAQTMKTVTVAGQNINVCLGTPISMLANLYSLSVPSDCVAYLGGAIGSRKASEYDAINIGSDAVFYKKATASYIESECIYCGRCHTHCPIGLLPYRILEAIDKKQSRKLTWYQIGACIGCGTCSAVCSSYLMPHEKIKEYVMNGFSDKENSVNDCKTGEPLYVSDDAMNQDAAIGADSIEEIGTIDVVPVAKENASAEITEELGTIDHYDEEAADEKEEV